MDDTRVAASYVQLLFEHMARLGRADALDEPPAPTESFVAMRRWQALLAPFLVVGSLCAISKR